MYEKCINEAELILGTQKNALAPVHKVWEEVIRRAKEQGFAAASLSDFSTMLEGDRRFVFIPASNENQQDEDAEKDGELEDTEMGRLGFFAEDHVKLRNSQTADRTISEDEEEIGSIRRMAFVSHTEIKKTAVLVRNGNSSSIKSKKPAVKIKISRKKLKTAGKTKKLKNRKSNSRLQRKK